ncbi:hypothetical protein AGMMS49942_21900 [Spirochaetia bacterium]|nr:hypothetical protein AGMMS49942_21900 [Spirochaetia bacterium]
MNIPMFKKIYWLSLFDGADTLMKLRDRYERYAEENIATADHRFLKILIGANYDPADARIVLDRIKSRLKIKTSLGMPLD